MILDKTMKIMTTGTAIKYYKDLGYDCGYRTIIEINQLDLPKNSNKIVEVQCDYCGTIFKAKRQDLNRGIIKKHACKKCTPLKAKESNVKKFGAESYMSTDAGKMQVKNTCVEKYGVDNPFKNQAIQEKQKETVRNKYGVDNVFQSDVVKEKIKNTNLDKYGVENPQQNRLIREKTILTCLKRYGTESPLQNKNVKEKIQNTNLKKYNVEIPIKNSNVKLKKDLTMLEKYGETNPIFVPELKEKMIIHSKNSIIKKYGTYPASKNETIKNKIRQAFVKNSQNMIPASRNQKYLCSLYNGMLNYNIGFYFLDIFLEDTLIDCEYDGSGHDLCVKLGNISESEFKIKEIKRYYYLKQRNIKLFKIIHKNSEILPSDNLLINIKDYAINYLSKNGCNWIIFDLDNNIIKTKNSIKMLVL